MSCLLCKETNLSGLGVKNNCELVVCDSCGFIFMYPMPENAQLEELYSDYRQTKNYLKKLKKKLFTSKYKLKRLGKYLNSDKKSFLDVGCSIGATVEAAHRLGYQAMGIDLDEAVLEHSATMFPACEFKAINTIELAKLGNTFDLIYCAEVIEHVPDPHAFVESLNSLLKPGSILYLTTPDAGHRKVPGDFVSWSRVTPPEHIAYFSRQAMQKVLEAHGFEVIKFLWSHRANMRVICRKKILNY